MTTRFDRDGLHRRSSAAHREAPRVRRPDFIPDYGAVVTEWHTLHDDGTVVIQVASAEAMLVMKLRANRPGRDERDIANLLAICDVTTLDDAETLYESYYPADLLPDRAVRMVERILQVGLPETPKSPPRPDFGD